MNLNYERDEDKAKDICDWTIARSCDTSSFTSGKAELFMCNLYLESVN